MDQVVSVTDDEMGGSPTVFKIKTIMRVFEFQAKDEEDRYCHPSLLMIIEKSAIRRVINAQEYVDQRPPRRNRKQVWEQRQQ